VDDEQELIRVMVAFGGVTAEMHEERMATPLAKQALKALKKAVAENGGRPLTDAERAELAARLHPGLTQRDAGDIGLYRRYHLLGSPQHPKRPPLPLSSTTILCYVLRISERSLARARRRVRGGLTRSEAAWHEMTKKITE
jgi:hypothetical protein